MKKRTPSQLLLIFSLLSFLFQSCSFNQSILFKTDHSINEAAFSNDVVKAEANYKIQPGDFLAMTVYTNKGEALVDPNNEFKTGTDRQNVNNNAAQQQQMNMEGLLEVNYPLIRNNNPINTYLVSETGEVDFPMIGKENLLGLTLAEANDLLEEKYSEYYKEPYISIQYLNKRVFLLGAAGDQVIPLRNENMTLVEVLALSGNFQSNAKAEKVRLIRGDLSNPSVLLVDLTTLDGVKKANLKVLPGDIVYVEPRRKVDQQTLGNLNLIVSTITSLITLYLLIENIK